MHDVVHAVVCMHACIYSCFSFQDRSRSPRPVMIWKWCWKTFWQNGQEQLLAYICMSCVYMHMHAIELAQEMVLDLVVGEEAVGVIHAA